MNALSSLSLSLFLSLLLLVCFLRQEESKQKRAGLSACEEEEEVASGKKAPGEKPLDQGREGDLDKRRARDREEGEKGTGGEEVMRMSYCRAH